MPIFSMKTIKNKQLYIYIIGVLIGGIAGYFYYINFACNSGCPLNSSPYMSILWGGVLGYLFSDMFKGKKPKKEQSEEINL